jgi:hypothetical protein
MSTATRIRMWTVTDLGKMTHSLSLQPVIFLFFFFFLQQDVLTMQKWNHLIHRWGSVRVLHLSFPMTAFTLQGKEEKGSSSISVLCPFPYNFVDWSRNWEPWLSYRSLGQVLWGGICSYPVPPLSEVSSPWGEDPPLPHDPAAMMFCPSAWIQATVEWVNPLRPKAK